MATERPPGVARLVAGDAYIGVRLLRDAVRRITGLHPDASLLATVFAFGVLAHVLHRVATPALRILRPRQPSFAGTMMATAALRGLPRGIAGGRSAETPFTGTLIGVSLVAPMMHAAAIRLLRAPAALAAFVRRYGV